MTAECYGEIPEGRRALHGVPSRKSSWTVCIHAGSSSHPCANSCSAQANREMPTAKTTRQRVRHGVLRGTPSRDRPARSEDTAGKLTRGHRRGKPPSGAGPDGAGPGRSLAVAGHPIGAYRCSGRTDRSLTHGDEPLPNGVGCRRASGQGGLTPCRARWLQGTQRCLARVSGR
jgi:hypothetical protein